MALGYPHPDYLLEQITSRQYVEWLAFDSIDPIGGTRGDIQAGVIASVIANVNRDSKKRNKPYNIIDFMPFVVHGKETLADKVRNTMRALKNG